MERAAEDQAELLEDEVGQIGAERADRNETARQAGHRAGGGAADRRAADERPRVLGGLELRRRGLECFHLAAQLIVPDAFLFEKLCSLSFGKFECVLE